ncbi:hypothetical protein SAMN05444172_1606 [Burkholderia sp. GAS332]|nr:hypothetical protein SAMN05444172_1606 [Burkholderia sp. GAS332]
MLLSNVEVASSRVEFCDSPIVLLCGGRVGQEDGTDNPDLPVASLRHAITRSSVDYEIFRPEEITSWQVDGVFQNLMDFEADLASICSLVVVILESPGSLVELGAFSQLPDFRGKIIAITSSEFVNKNSFINLGILRFIKEIDNSRVKSYPWNIDDPAKIEQDTVNDVISDLKGELEKLDKSQTFKVHSRSHVMVLICEIIRLFVALKEGEIIEYLEIFGVRLSKKELRSKFFLLERFKLIKKVTYSDSDFYMRTDETYHKIRLSLKNPQPQDALRVEAQCLAYYDADGKQKHRQKAIAEAKRGAGA